MNLARTSAASYFLFNDGASGTGGAAAPASNEGASSASGTPSGSAAVSSDSSGAAPDAGGASTSAAAQSDAFSGLDEDWGDEIEITPVSGTDPAAGAPGETQPPGAKEPAAPAAPAATPPALAPAAAQSPPPKDPATSAGSRSPLEEAIEGFKAQKGPLTDWAAGEVFKLSKEEAEALETNAVEMIPKLMARTYVEGMIATKNLLRNFVPQMIQSEVARHTSVTKRSSEALDQFYGAHKELDRTQHQPVVDKWLKAFRANNPKASRQEAIDFVGRAVKLELGIAATPPTSGGAQPVKVMPFAPARQGGKAPINNSQQGTPYDGLDFEFDGEVA